MNDLPLCFIDFETRSEVPIEAGSFKYAADPSTEIRIACWAIDEGPVETRLGSDPRLPEPGSVQFIAWNAQFEERIMLHCLDRYEDVICAAALARSWGLPSALGNCARYLTEQFLKGAGRNLIKRFCEPPFEEEEGPLWDTFVDYCQKDVEVLRTIWNLLPNPTERQLQDYRVNEAINERGITIDRDYVKSASEYAAVEEDALRVRMKALMGRDRLQGPKLTQWVYDRLPTTHKQYMEADTKSGLSLARHVRTSLSECRDLDPQTREVIEVVDAAASASTKKLRTMLKRVGHDGRIRGSFRYFGAHTGRFSGHGFQPQNMPRDTFDPAEVERVRDMIVAKLLPGDIVEETGHDIIETLKRTLRGCLVSKDDCSFVCADWSQIEGRVNPWLAGCQDGEDKLQQYRDYDAGGTDVYTLCAARILGKAVEDVDTSGGTDERLLYGKVPELALGFGGATGALMNIAASYNVASAIDDAMALRIVQQWRRTNPWAPRFWNSIMTAVKLAFLHPGDAYPAGRLKYVYAPRFLGGTMFCMLPSGRNLTYPMFRMNSRQYEDGFVYANKSHLPKADKRKWPPFRVWHGLLCENAVQGLASDILRDTLATLDGFLPVVAHSHDEVLVEVSDVDVESTKQDLIGIMTDEVPEYAGLPLAVDVWHGKAYRK